MFGPRLYYFTDEASYQAFLKLNKVSPWYMKYNNRFRPGMFTHTDGDGTPDTKDVVWVGPKEWEALKTGEKWAKNLLHHEWLHNLVISRDAVREGLVPARTRRMQLEYFSHPNKPWAALCHAKRTGFRTNAFTRFLRWRRTTYKYQAFELWYRYIMVHAKPWKG